MSPRAAETTRGRHKIPFETVAGSSALAPKQSQDGAKRAFLKMWSSHWFVALIAPKYNNPLVRVDGQKYSLGAKHMFPFRDQIVLCSGSNHGTFIKEAVSFSKSQ